MLVAVRLWHYDNFYFCPLQDALISEFPQQFADRQRIVSAALASHLQYNDTVDHFTSWLLNFEKSLRSSTDVHLDDVPLAVDVIKVCMSHIGLTWLYLVRN